MEVGAIKQAFNNEIILLKKNLNQAKTQTIHKLTRKAKQLTDKKAPDEIKEKFNRKAESAVKEVLILKKIKPRDIAQFIVTHKGQLNEYMNKPLNKDKACARLLLHKAMQEKYKYIREKFANVSIKDLFMSRQERLKLKKEAKEKQKNKKKGKDKAVNVEGEWDVEMMEGKKESNAVKSNDNDKKDDDDTIDTDNDISEDENISNNSSSQDHPSSEEESEGNISDEDISQENNDHSEENDNSSNEKAVQSVNLIKQNQKVNKKTNDTKQQKPKKPKENKNRNLNEKLQKRKFNKESDDNILQATKTVDPFFITSSGDNYMSLVEPRQPDEVKEVHKQGNRQYRRAVMFGHVPKPRKNQDNRKNNFDNGRNNLDNRRNNLDNQQNNFDNKKNNYDRQTNRDFEQKSNKFAQKNKYDKDIKTEVPEKLHPSWEAKKKQSSILPFQGKKIVFD